MPKVSVIVPVYHVEKYINKFVDSLINQTLSDIEIILVDDESPDNCGKICDEYAAKDSRISVIHKKNGGVSEARNDGIRNAKSDFVMFVDSDDWCEPNMCEVAYNSIIDTNSDIAIFNYYNNYENYERKNNNIPVLELDTYKDIEKLQMTIFHSDFIRLLDEHSKYYLDLGAPWSKIFKRNFLIDNNLYFDKSLKGIFDDVFFCLYSLEKAKKVVTRDVALYHWRRLDNTLSTSFKKDNLEKYSKITEECEKFVKNTNKGDLFYRSYYARIILNILKLLKFYYCNELNDLPVKERKIMLKKNLSSEPYKTAIKEVEKNDLNKHQKIYLILFKLNNPTLIMLFYKFKSNYDKIKQKKIKGIN